MPPIIPATWKAEAEELLELGRRRLQWAKIVPLHSSLADRVILPPKINEKNPMSYLMDFNLKQVVLLHFYFNFKEHSFIVHLLFAYDWN